MMPGLTISEGGEGIIGPRSTSDGRSRMPLPRAGLPPAKRSSMESNSSNPSPSGGGLSSSSATGGGGGEQGISLTSTPLSVDGSEAKDGLGGLIGERLAMPSCGSLYSEEDAASLSSTDDSSGPVRGVMRLSSSGSRHSSSTKNSMSEGPPSIFKKKKDDGQQQLAPIELKPDRKFFSFQGASQYKQAVEDADTSSTRLETIVSPSRPSMGGGQPMLSTMNQGPQHATPQYQPSLRNQHGVTEMADTKDLNAIFKAPRNTTQGANTAGPSPKIVSPGTPAASIATMTTGGGSPMMQDASVGHSAAAVDQHLQQTYPVDDRQWSIPSIRMAKHINLSSNNLSAYNHGSYASFSEYTDDDGSLDESYYSFLGDDDDASLSSRGSVDPVVRRRRFLRASMEMASSQAANVAENVDGSLGGSADSSSQPPAIGQSNSFIEKIQGISIENNTDTTMEGTTPSAAIPPHLTKRANTFDSEIMMVDDAYGDNTNVGGGGLDINGPPPILNVHSSTSQGNAMDDADYHQSRRRRRHRGRGRRRREGAAMGWIQELQSQTNDAQLITESASSKFMAATSNIAGGSAAQTNNFGMTSEDVTKALGMPHPLCRSSTIEAGPFTIGIHREMGFGNSGSGGDIALNSSGSGESPPVGAF